MNSNEASEIRIYKIKTSYLKMLLYSVTIVLFGVSISHIFNNYYPLGQIWSVILEYIGYICWGTTLGSIGTSLFNWNSGASPEEILDQRLSKIFSMIGIFVFVMARALEYT